jgi:hypothetical protein
MPHPVIDSPLWTRLAWASLLALVLWMGLLALNGAWWEWRVALAFAAPFLVMMLVPHGMPPLLVGIAAGSFTISALGWALDWYALYWWFDLLLHTLNPFVIMAGSMFMLWKADLLPMPTGSRAFIGLSTLIGLALGILWELLELTFLVLTWADTLSDIVADTVGAALGGWFAGWLIRARGLAPVGRRGRSVGFPVAVRAAASPAPGSRRVP